MDDATQRLDHRSLGHIKSAANGYRVDCRHRNELSQSTWQPGDPVPSIELPLMRISRAAVLAERGSFQARTVQSLVHHHTVADLQIKDLVTYLFDASADLVSQDLWLDVKRDGLAILVHIIVCVTGKNLRVRAAETDRRNSHQHFVRRNTRARNLAHFETFDVAQDAGPHSRRRSRGQSVLFEKFDRSAQTAFSWSLANSGSRSPISNRQASRKTAKRRMVSRTPASSGVDGNSPITRLIAASSIAAAIGIGGPPYVTNSRSGRAEFRLMSSAIRATPTVSPWRLNTCAPAGAASAQAIKAAAVSATYWKSVAPLKRM